ncbi:MAG: hypothetical protein ACYDG0_03985 [Vulcanimicrobiaceae bacterium]
MPYSPHYDWLRARLEVEPGWIPLVADMLAEIDAARRNTGTQIEIRQVKEKFALLTVYWDGDKRYADIIARAVERANQTCQACGSFGLMRVIGGDWYALLCWPCAVKRAERRGGATIELAEITRQ